MKAFLKKCFIDPTNEMDIPFINKVGINVGRYMVATGMWLIIIATALYLIYFGINF